MNHIAEIQAEFLKEARKWEDMSLDFQRGYLKRHPKSQRHLTTGKGSIWSGTGKPRVNQIVGVDAPHQDFYVGRVKKCDGKEIVVVDAEGEEDEYYGLDFLIKPKKTDVRAFQDEESMGPYNKPKHVGGGPFHDRKRKN